MVEFRLYQPEDRESIGRLWKEVGWSDPSDEGEVAALDSLLGTGMTEVAVIDGAAEAMAQNVPGDIFHTGTKLSMSAITAVLTSLVGRKMGLATTLTARAIAEGARSGAAVSVLGVFETGFYERLGFGTGSYEHELTFDPTSLALDHVTYRRPVRLGVDDAEEMHAALSGRLRSHGSAALHSPAHVAAELGWMKNAWALGYRTDGRLTHFMAGTAKDDRHFRPYFVAYETIEQLLELLRLARELGDQLYRFTMMEPPEIQLQDLIRGPIRQIGVARDTNVQPHRAKAFWQLRINDLAAVVSSIDWPGEPVRFNLAVSDPIERLDVGWPGIGDNYLVELSADSLAEPGADSALPTLTTAVGPLSRLLFGVVPTSTLAALDHIGCPAELAAALDRALQMPQPHLGWDF
ncbi:MAG: GNAT family N-acetyltransferase [Acidimicrobiales bacterium]|nr:GNAT family N-acetyltransferase [Acidimicrobiales bacterium]